MYRERGREMRVDNAKRQMMKEEKKIRRHLFEFMIGRNEKISHSVFH